MTAVGQIMGLVLAKDRLTAQRAAKAVRVEYRELPAVLTIDVSWQPTLICTSNLSISFSYTF